MSPRRLNPSAELTRLRRELAEINRTGFALARQLGEAEKELTASDDLLTTAVAVVARGGPDDERVKAVSKQAELRAQVADLQVAVRGYEKARRGVEADIGALYRDHADHFIELARGKSEEYLVAERELRRAIEHAEAAWQDVGRAWGVIPNDLRPDNAHLPLLEFDALFYAIGKLRDSPPYPRGMEPAEVA